jgi:hypothetical protein
MAALETFEWFVTTRMKMAGEDVRSYIRKEREYLFSLRSEDERQREVDQALAVIKEMMGSAKKA